MKRIVIAVVCLVLAIGLAVFGYVDLNQISDKMQAEAQMLIQSAQQENATETAAQLETFLNDYEHYAVRLGAYVNHGELDDAELLVRGLSDKLENGNTEEFTEDLYEIQYQFAHLSGSESPKFQNVF
ncbi:MAG: DUF4363 family protein [Candidatus Fimenecus sp.]